MADNAGSLRAVEAVEKALRELGWNVMLWLQGVAATIREQGENVAHFGLPFPSDYMEVVRTSDLVVTGLSNPMKGEDVFAGAANKHGIPLVQCEFTWGELARTQARPDIVLTIDSVSESLGKKHRPDAKFIQVGHPAVKKASGLEVRDSAREFMTECRQEDRFIVLLAGQSPLVTAEIIRCIGESHPPKDFGIVYKPHPKFADAHDNAAVKMMLNELCELGVAIHRPCNEEATANELAVLCDATISSFSGVLMTAATWRKPAFSVETKLTSAAMLTETGIDYYPPTRLSLDEAGSPDWPNAVTSLWEEEARLLDLCGGDAGQKMRLAQETFVKPFAFPTTELAEAIEELLRGD